MAADEASKAFKEGVVELFFRAGQQSEARVTFSQDWDGQKNYVFLQFQGPDKINIWGESFEVIQFDLHCYVDGSLGRQRSKSRNSLDKETLTVNFKVTAL